MLPKFVAKVNGAGAVLGAICWQNARKRECFEWFLERSTVTGESLAALTVPATSVPSA